MAKIFTLRRILLLFAFLTLLSNFGQAQSVVTIGTGTSSTYQQPLNRWYNYSCSEMIYTAAEIGMAGNISSVGWYKSSGLNTMTINSVSIYMKSVTNSTVTNYSDNSGYTLVYTGSFPNTALGWNSVTLTTPFLYTSGNLSIIVVKGFEQYASGYPYWAYTTTSSNQCNYYYNDVTGWVSNSTYSYTSTSRPNVRLEITPLTPCVAPPTAGTANASVTSICPGGPVSLSLSGNSIGSGMTFQWQSATSTTGPWSNVGTAASFPATTVAPTTTQYYRCAVTCGSSTTYSSNVLITVASLFPAGTYTINSGAPTAGTNFNSFADAVSAISCGIAGHVIFNVVTGSGPYNEQVDIPDINNDSSKTVTFNGNNEVLTYSNTNTSNYAILRLNGADYFRIKKLKVQPLSSGSYGIGILLTNNADNNIIDSCEVTISTTITSSYFDGIALSGSSTSPTTSGSLCDYNTISNNVITGGYYGLTMYGSSTTVPCESNKVLNNIIKDMYYTGGYFYYNNNLSIIGNDISRPTRASSTSFYGILSYYAGNGFIVSKNRIHSPFANQPTSTNSAYAFMLYYATGTAANPCIFSNNIVYDFLNTGVQYGMYNYSNGYANVYHNTILLDNAATTSSTTYGFYNYLTTAEYKNNIVHISRGGSGSKYCFYRSSGTITSDNNDYLMASTSGANYTGYFSANQTTLANWQTASAGDANSVAVNPMYVSASTGDLTPTNLSMDDLGTPIAAVTDDITGYTRSVVFPDMGAFEFHNCNTPTGLTPSATSSTNITVSWNVIANVLGYEYIVDQSSAYPTTAGTATTATSQLVTNLTPLTTYYFHLRTKCDTNNFSDWVLIPITTCVQANIFASGTTTFCNGDSVTLYGATSSAAPYTYLWKFNGNTISTDSAITVSTTGNYLLYLADTSANCADTSLMPTLVTVGAPPTSLITPSANAGLCPFDTKKLATNNAAGLFYQWYLNGSAIPGATDSVYNTAVTGSFTVKVSTGPSCSSTSTVPTVVSMLTQPPAQILAPAFNAICVNSYLPITANSGTGFTYQWMYNNAPIAGATAITYNAASAGGYTVQVKDANGCKDTSASLSLPIAQLPPASLSPNVPTTACDSLMLIANSGTGFTYQWNYNNAPITGATSISYAAKTTGPYYVTVIDGNNCKKDAQAVTATINPSPEATITYTSPITFCEGGAVAMVAYVPQGTGLQYQWLKNGSPIPGETTVNNVVDASGSYAVVVTNSFNCTKASAPVQVQVNSLPTPVAKQAGGYLTTDTSYMTYQWYLNGNPVPGATMRDFQFTSNGGYYVLVVDASGCQNISEVVFVNNVGVRTLAGSQNISIYPNPANDKFVVKADISGKVYLKDLSGRTLLQGATNTSISLQDIPAGLYMVIVTDKEDNLISVEKLTRMF